MLDKSTIALLVGIAFFAACIVAIVLRSRRLARYEGEAREHNNEHGEIQPSKPWPRR